MRANRGNNYSVERASQGQKWVSRRAALSLLASGTLAAATTALYRRWSVSGPSVPARPLSHSRTPTLHDTADTQVEIEKVYHESIAPSLVAFDGRNNKAVDRAIATLHERMEIHRRQVRLFTRDIASWHTRFGILRRYPSDLWHRLRGTSDSRAVNEYVNAKFRKYILSERGLERDVTAALASFNYDVDASRNELYSQLLLPLQRIKTIQPRREISLDTVRRESREAAERLGRSLPADTLATGLLGVAGGWIAADVAQAMTTRVVGQILTRLAVAMAAEGVAAGGATVEGAAAGGGAGSFAGPVGTIIGIGVGLIIGAIVDWRLSKRFEAKIAQQCNQFLDGIERRLRDGDSRSPGLRQVLMQTIDVTNRAQEQAIQVALKENLR